MKLTTRLTRAGASFLIFGVVAAAVPNSGMMGAGACGGGGGNSDFQNACWFAAGVGAGLIVGEADRKHHNDDTASNAPAATVRPAADKSWNDLHAFVTDSGKSL